MKNILGLAILSLSIFASCSNGPNNIINYSDRDTLRTELDKKLIKEGTYQIVVAFTNDSQMVEGKKCPGFILEHPVTKKRNVAYGPLHLGDTIPGTNGNAP